jgi:hypothetical protein
MKRTNTTMHLANNEEMAMCTKNFKLTKSRSAAGKFLKLNVLKPFCNVNKKRKMKEFYWLKTLGNYLSTMGIFFFWEPEF